MNAEKARGVKLTVASVQFGVRDSRQVPRLVARVRDRDDVASLGKLEPAQVCGGVGSDDLHRHAWRALDLSSGGVKADVQVPELQHQRLRVGEDEHLEAGRCVASRVGDEGRPRPVDQRAVHDRQEVLAGAKTARVPRIVRATAKFGSDFAAPKASLRHDRAGHPW
jgi:hypothetical protein